jgi:hypothetical protein
MGIFGGSPPGFVVGQQVSYSAQGVFFARSAVEPLLVQETVEEMVTKKQEKTLPVS